MQGTERDERGAPRTTPFATNKPRVRALTPEQSDLDYKINLLFAGVVVRKDLVKAVKGNAIVPSFVLEYLLGQYAASDDEATIQAGIGSVRQILADHYVHRNQSELVKSTIRERGRHKIIDKVTVTLNDRGRRPTRPSSPTSASRAYSSSPRRSRRTRSCSLAASGASATSSTFHSEDDPKGGAVDRARSSIKPIQLSNFGLSKQLPRGAPDESSPPMSGSIWSSSPSASTQSCSVVGPSSSSSCG